MATDSWRTVPLGSLCEGIYDGPHATPKKTDSGPIFLGISNISQGRLDLSNTEHLSEEDFIHWTRRVTPRPNDIVFSYETRLGEAALIPEGLRCCLGRRMGLLRVDLNKANPRFLLYAYLGPEFQETIRARTIYGSTVDRIPLIALPDFPISVPSLCEQYAIAHILGTIDDKIELNRQMNETLEAIARAIFKSWFVDFDAVRAKMDGRLPAGMDTETATLFPDALEDSELGKIPKGWSIKSVGEVIDDLYDGPHATPAEASEGAVFLGIKNLTGTQLDLTEIRYISEEDWSQWTKRVIPRPNDIVFTYEATLGAFAIIPPGLRCCLGRRLALIRPKVESLDHCFLFHTFVSAPFQELLLARANQGSTVNRIPLRDFPGYPLLWAPRQLINRFHQLAAPIWSRIHHNQAESSTLISIRDTLLPKLLSGEIRVKDAEKFL